MTEQKIRNAFIVAPDGEIEERAYDEKWAQRVNALEHVRDELLRHKRENER